MNVENDFIITVKNTVVSSGKIESLSSVLNNPEPELFNASDFIISDSKICGQQLKQIPIEFEEAMQTGVFNRLGRVKRDILVYRYEEPRMGVIKTAAKSGFSISHTSYLENEAIAEIRAFLACPRLVNEDDFMIGEQS